MKIFFPKESEKETRSALDLASAKRLIDLGIEVSFESGVTQKIDIADQDLEDIGCKNESRSEGLSNSEIISSVNHLPLSDLDSVSENTLTISFLDAVTIDNDGNMELANNFLPDGDNDADLGSASKRWANLFVGDLELSNEGSGGNDVDGTEGKWTIQEGEENLYLLNRKNNKKYKFLLEEIE